MDRLMSLLPRFGFQVSMLYRGDFCGQNRLSGEDGAGQLHLLRGGDLLIEHPEGRVIELNEPALVFYPRPCDHRLVVPPGAQARLYCASIHFRHLRRNPIALSLPPLIVIPLSAAPHVARLLALLFDETERDEPGYRLVLDHLCDILVVYLVRHALRENLVQSGMLAGLWDAQIAPALAALHAGPERQWTIGDMACVAHMSRTAFANRFREVTGTPPAEYLNTWRMELAQTYLCEGRAVKEVAQAVGYRTQPAFTRAFSDKYGLPPTEWLKNRRGSAQA